MITVWGRATSGNVQIVMWAAAELGLDVDRRDVGGAFGGTNTPEYLAMNPNGLVPTVQDGELTMWESAAVVRYLGATYGDEKFWPRSPAERAPIDMWAEWTKTSFVVDFIGGIFAPLVFRAPSQRDPAAIAAAEKRVQRLARIADARMVQSAYLGGDHPAFGDYVFGAPLYRYFTLNEFERAETPHLRAYFDRLTQRPAYSQHVMIEYDSLRPK